MTNHSELLTQAQLSPRLLIDGQHRAAADGGVIETLDPASAQLLATCPAGNAADIDAAVDATVDAAKKGLATLANYSAIKAVTARID